MSARGRVFGRVIAAAGGAASALRAWDQATLGYPDGHLTALDIALRTPHRVLVVATVVAALVLLRWSDRRGWMMLVITLVVADWIVLPAVGAALGLEHGGGG